MVVSASVYESNVLYLLFLLSIWFLVLLLDVFG